MTQHERQETKNNMAGEINSKNDSRSVPEIEPMVDPLIEPLIEIETKHFGRMTIEEREILKFPNGILAFEAFTNYVILPVDKDSIFHWLQSLDDPKLSFLLLEPYAFLPGYVPDIFAYEIENLFGSRDISHLSVWCIVTIPPNHPEKMTINAQGPIVISTEKRLGGQFISNNESHLVRTPVLEPAEAGVMA